MQVAAHDVSRLSRALAGCAGLAVAIFGAVRPAEALVPAGLSLVLAVLPLRSRYARIPGYLLGLLAAAFGVAALREHPPVAVAIVLAGLALALIDVRVPRRPGGVVRYRVADPLLAGAATIALVAVVPRMFAPTFPDGRGPDILMSPLLAGALLTLTAGVVLARPEAGPLRTTAAAGPGTTIRRVLPALIAVPVIAALVSALAVRTGISRPVAAISTGAVLAALAVLALVAYLIRTLEGADRRQRELVSELHRREESANTMLQSLNEGIADRERAEKALTEHADELLQSNGQLREANARLEDALAFKNDLTSMLTHDVAQPISSIASLAELLRADWADLPDDIKLELATKIDKNTQRLIKMMNDLQLLFRLDTGSVTARRTPVPLHEVLESAAAGKPDVRIAGGPRRYAPGPPRCRRTRGARRRRPVNPTCGARSARTCPPWPTAVT